MYPGNFVKLAQTFIRTKPKGIDLVNIRMHLYFTAPLVTTSPLPILLKRIFSLSKRYNPFNLIYIYVYPENRL